MTTKKLEYLAWRDTQPAGVALPEDLERMWSQVDELRAELEAVNRQTADRVQAPSLILAGATVAEAVDAERQAAHTAELLEARRTAASQAVKLLTERISRTTAVSHEELIVRRLRPVVSEIVTEARALVDKLEPFAPAFDPDEVAKWATPAQLKAWRTAAELQDRLDRCLAAWLASWRTSTSGTSDHKVPPYLRIDAPGGAHAWEHPEQVADIDVRDGRTTKVLAIAVHADAGYRLASGAEMLELSERVQLNASWAPGEQKPRQVFLPGDPMPQRVATDEKRPRAVFL